MCEASKWRHHRRMASYTGRLAAIYRALLTHSFRLNQRRAKHARSQSKRSERSGDRRSASLERRRARDLPPALLRVRSGRGGDLRLRSGKLPAGARGPCRPSCKALSRGDVSSLAPDPGRSRLGTVEYGDRRSTAPQRYTHAVRDAAILYLGGFLAFPRLRSAENRR